MKNKTKLFLLPIIALLLVISLGISYAYFSALINGNHEEVLVTSGTMILEIEDGENLIGNKKIKPGDKIVKEFTIKNTGTLATTYNLYFSEVLNNFSTPSDLVYTLEPVDSDGATISQTQVPISSNIILSDQYIDGESEHNYKLTIEYLNTNQDQSVNIDKVFSFKLNIREANDVEIDKVFYLDNVVVDSMPNSYHEYLANESSCTYGAVINFNTSEWLYGITNVSNKNTVCTLKFATTYNQLVFDANGGEVEEQTRTVEAGTTYGSLPTPTRTGYTFNEWQDSNGNTVTEDTIIEHAGVTIYAHWTPNQYVITFDNQSADTAGTTSIAATYDSNLTSITIPTKTGYTFKGYYTAANGAGTKYVNEDGTSASVWKEADSITLYAKWSVNTYNITFDSNYNPIGFMNGAAWVNDYIEFDGEDDYVVLGKHDYANYTVEVVGSYFDDITTRDMDIFNNWSNGGFGICERNNGLFRTGAYIELYGGYQSVNSTTTIVPGVKYYATGTYDGTDFKIYINGVLEATNTIEGEIRNTSAGTELTIGSDANRDGAAGDTLHGKIYEARIYNRALTASEVLDNYNGNITYDGLQKNITSDTRDLNKVIIPKTYGQAYGTLPDVQRSGYTFEGWYTAATGGTRVLSSTLVNNASATTLYAHWSSDQFTVTLNDQGATTSGTEAIYDRYDTGYYLDQAETKQMTTSANAITKPQRKYTVTYDYNGNNQSNTTANSTYTFTGYYNNTSDEPIQYIDANGNITLDAQHLPWDRTLYAKWTGEAVTLPTPNARTGYNFSGWYTAKTGGSKIGNAGATYTPTDDITLYARWTAKTYTLSYDTGDYIYGLDNISNITNNYIKYSISNGTVTVTANRDDGWGYTIVRVYLTANKTYIFNCATDGTWGNTTGSDTVEAYLALNGNLETLERMTTNSNFEFTPTVTGEYWLRLDVNKNGITHTFSNISVKEKVASKSITYDSTYGTLGSPIRAGYDLEGWYTDSNLTNKVTSSTKVTTTSNQTLYAKWTAALYEITLDNDGGTGSVSKIYLRYGVGYYLDSAETKQMSINANSITKPSKNYDINYYYNYADSNNNYNSYGMSSISSFNGFNTKRTSDGLVTLDSVSVINSNGYLLSNVSTRLFVDDSTIYASFSNFPVTLDTISRGGYVFDGWYDSAEGGTKIGNGGAYYSPSSTSVNLYAHWTLTVDLQDTLIPVNYTVSGSNIVYKVADVSNYKESWFSYENHNWANAVLVSSSNRSKYQTAGTTITESDILQMYVWIPRYRYYLFNVGDGTTINEKMINVAFEDCKAVNGVCSNQIYTKQNGNANNKWLTHPAFTFGSSELNGMWVGKFKTSASSGINSSNDRFCESIGCSNVSKLRIKSNSVSLTNINVADMFNLSRSVESYSTFGFNTSKTDSHMMKNMEWGAVAYFTQSKYGLFKNSTTCNNTSQATSNGCEVFINNINVGYGSDTSNPNGLSYAYGPTVTGCSASTADAESSNTTSQTNPTCASNYKWYQNGVLASTTGNMYGIYDMSGGGWEMVMGNASSSTIEYLYSAGSSGLTQPADKYITHYLASTSSTPAKDQSRGLLGDATKEVLKTYGVIDGAWNSDYSEFPANGGNVWFGRGGRPLNTVNAGIFATANFSGGRYNYGAFRVVLTTD